MTTAEYNRRRIANGLQPSTAIDANRLGAGTYNGLSKDLLDHTLYDTVPFSTTLPNQSFFQTGLGQPLGASITTPKTLAHTNMKNGARLPAGWAFLIKGIAIHLVNRAVDATETGTAKAAAFIRVLEASNFRLKFPGRDFDCEFPGDTFLPTISVTDLNAATINSSRVGDFMANKILPLRNQIVIGDVGGSSVDFTVDWAVDNTDAGVAAALTTLTAGTNADAFKVALIGTLEKLK